MKNKMISIVDYGLGNLFSVTRSFECNGATVRIVSDEKEILNSDRLVLPGVGAFADGIRGLKENNLFEGVRTFARSGRPFLGICLGMQLLLEKAFEFGEHEGLSLVEGTVEAIPKTTINGNLHKIPHIGWNELLRPKYRLDWNHSILSGIEPGQTVYFVHSFEVKPKKEESLLSYVDYNGRQICAAIENGNIWGCQFHPEKSGVVGLKILNQFLEL